MWRIHRARDCMEQLKHEIAKKGSRDANSKRIRTRGQPVSSLSRYPSGNLVDWRYLIYSGHCLDNSYASYELRWGIAGVVEPSSRSPLQMRWLSMSVRMGDCNDGYLQLKLEDLRIFIAVTDAGGLSLAARRRHLCARQVPTPDARHSPHNPRATFICAHQRLPACMNHPRYP